MDIGAGPVRRLVSATDVPVRPWTVRAVRIVRTVSMGWPRWMRRC